MKTVSKVIAAIAFLILSAFAFFLDWCKWFGFAWVLSHFFTIEPVQVGTIIFIVIKIIFLCAKGILYFNKKDKEKVA